MKKRSNESKNKDFGGEYRIRTGDLLHAMQAYFHPINQYSSLFV